MLYSNLKQFAGRKNEPDCIVVIGAGAVGIHLAVQLARAGQDVIVLESGDETLSNFSSDSYSVIGRKHEGIRLGRSVALGGTTNLWGGQLVEFNPLDIDGREWLSESKWPVSYEELAAYYGPTYDALGIEQSLQEDDYVWQTLKKESPKLGPKVELFLSRWLKTPNLAAIFRKEIETNTKISVVLNTTVTGFTGVNGRIETLKVCNAEGEQHSIAGGDFVLSAGTIENARLLLHAAADQSWNCPWKQNDNVGRYFQDHLGGRVAMIKPRDSKAFYDLFCTIVLRSHKFQPKLRLFNELMAQEPVLNCQAWIAFENSIKENLVFLKQFFQAALYSRKIGSISGFFRNAFACARHMIPLMWKFVVEHRILIPSGSRISLTVQAETEPMRESRIKIDCDKRNKLGLPQVLLDWQLSGNEIHSIASFTRRVETALQQAGLADLVIEPALLNEDLSFLDQLHDTNHHSGGCIMGENAKRGVVDKNLRVFGTDNLYANGACIFRTNSNANCTFTALAFATRLANYLAKDSYEASIPKAD